MATVSRRAFVGSLAFGGGVTTPGGAHGASETTLEGIPGPIGVHEALRGASADALADAFVEAAK